MQLEHFPFGHKQLRRASQHQMEGRLAGFKLFVIQRKAASHAATQIQAALDT
ncbi:hypothetical protein GCM10007863_37500 [Dyella mobilis]|nr:hypothetical protein GCM10007863_37500 [Dyella mobilis]